MGITMSLVLKVGLFY